MTRIEKLIPIHKNIVNHIIFWKKKSKKELKEVWKSGPASDECLKLKTVYLKTYYEHWMNPQRKQFNFHSNRVWSRSSRLSPEHYVYIFQPDSTNNNYIITNNQFEEQQRQQQNLSVAATHRTSVKHQCIPYLLISSTHI